ncbi:MAG: GC-type dockerin domain-anchored protein [Phycisphaerales bacterium JB040]
MRTFIAAAALTLTTGLASAQPDLPDVGECDLEVADRNADGVLDSADIYDFVEAFIAGDESADLNNDGVVDTMDIVAYIRAAVPCFLANHGG